MSKTSPDIIQSAKRKPLSRPFLLHSCRTRTLIPPNTRRSTSHPPAALAGGVQMASGKRKRKRRARGDEAAVAGGGGADWASLPRDAALEVFDRLGHCDRANAAGACRAWRELASSSPWTSLDLRGYRCDAKLRSSLAPRCGGLRRLQLRRSEEVAAASLLRAGGLREVLVDCLGGRTDEATLAVLATSHAALESIELGTWGFFGWRLSGDVLRHIAHCCPRLRCLHFSGIGDAGADAIGALASCCPLLEEVAFPDCPP